MTIQIIEVQAQAIQGLSGPYICKAENGCRYYVKGRHSGRESQVCELLGWYLAKGFGLPVPDAMHLELCEDLFDELPQQLQGIGKGQLFGIQEVAPARWFEVADMAWSQQQLRRDLLVFDYWVGNEDRGVGNPNLLFQDHEKRIIVIDHNRIFTETPADILISDHIFSAEWRGVSGDMMLRAEYGSKLQSALQGWDNACNNLPPEWKWYNDEQDIPIEFDMNRAYSMLCRFNDLSFWEVLQ